MSKPKKRQAAKRRSTRKPKPKRAPAVLAREGELDALFALKDRAAYKWLSAALDFGHTKASDVISDVLEVSDLRYDDSGHETAAAHWELAAAYLEGEEGLPRDLDLAKKHLARAFAHHHSLDGINDGTDEEYDADELLDRLPDDARKVLEAGLAGDDIARAGRHLQMLRRLIECEAPSVMIEAERRALRETVAVLCPLPTAEDIAGMGGDPLRDELANTERSLARLTELSALLRAEVNKRDSGG